MIVRLIDVANNYKNGKGTLLVFTCKAEKKDEIVTGKDGDVKLAKDEEVQAYGWSSDPNFQPLHRNGHMVKGQPKLSMMTELEEDYARKDNHFRASAKYQRKAAEALESL